jgi:hypothetical protein
MNRVSIVFYSILAAGLLVSPNAVSQVGLQVGGGAGYVIPMGDFGGATTDFYAGTKYGIGSGFNFHAKGRLNLTGLGFVGEVGYTSMSNDGESEPGQGKVELFQQIFSVRVGPEFKFNLPNVPVTPYLGANLGLNFITGEVKFTGVSSVPSGTYSEETATRLGAGISGGGMIEISNNVSLDIGLSYNFLNLIGQAWKDMDPTKDQRIDSYTSLNDDKDPVPLDDDEHFIGSARSIQTFQITASILFGL